MEGTKLSSLAGTQGGDAGKYAAKSWDELDRAGLLAELKANHPDLYEKYFKKGSTRALRVNPKLANMKES